LIGGLIALSLIGLNAGNSRNSKTPPHINWSQYAPYKKIGIEKSIAERSCKGLQRAFEASTQADLLEYIDWHLNNLGCYK
jgi:hypothetical protein